MKPGADGSGASERKGSARYPWIGSRGKETLLLFLFSFLTFLSSCEKNGLTGRKKDREEKRKGLSPAGTFVAASAKGGARIFPHRIL